MAPPKERHRKPQPPVTPRKETGRGHQSRKSEDRHERRPAHDSAGAAAPRRAPAPVPAAPPPTAPSDAEKAARAAAAVKAAKAAAAAAAIEAALVDSSEEEEEDDDDEEDEDDEEEEDDDSEEDEEEEEAARAAEAARRAKVARAAKAAEEARAARAAKAAETAEAMRMSEAESAEAARASEAARVAKVIEAARAAEAARATAAAAAFEAAATAPTFSSPPANPAATPAANPAGNPAPNSSATNPQTNPNEPQTHTTANGEVVETLYSHPTAKIISFTAGARSFAGEVAAMSASRTRNRRSTSEEDVEAGTLEPSSQFERTIAVGALCIYRAPGSVAFLSCGSALQPILPKSQCWCIDEDSSRFILQIRRPQYWRIEIPVGDGGENDGRAQRLREVLDYILQFEKTPCPFKRSFTVELPDQPSTPMKKKPWTPVKRSDVETPPTPVTPSNAGAQPKTQQPSRSPSPPDEDSVLSASPRQMHSSPLSQAQSSEFSRREWAAMLESQRKGSIDLEDERKRIVPALIAEHERIISEAMAGDLEVTRTGHVWRNSISTYMPPPTDRHGGPRERSMSMVAEGSGARPAWPGLDQTWFEMESDRSTAESSSPFNSLRSWLSAGRNMASSPPSSAASQAGFTTSDGMPIPPGLASLYEDARRVFASSTLTEQPRIHHRATASSISMSNPSPMPPAVNILTPSRQVQRYNVGRARTRMQAMRRIPGTVMVRVMEILLAPPGYLIALMLRVAARILSGEWRGSALGKTDSGENIPVHWDYTDVEDPLGRSIELHPRSAVDRLNVYTEADVDVYTDVENHDDDDDDESDDGEFSSPGTPTKLSSFSRARASSQASDENASESDTDTLSDAGGDPVVWTRRWAVD